MARILLVEDERNLRLFMALNLKAYGYGVVEAQDGTEALQILQNDPFDLVVTDLPMPNTNGVELIDWLKRERPHIPVIAVSAADASLSEARDLRADAVLKKPFAVQELLRVAQTVLQRQNQ